MALTLRDRYRLALAAAVLIVACDSAGPDGEARHSQVQIDLRQLAPTGQQGGPISVIDTVTLTIEPEDGAEQQLRRPAKLTDAPVTFDVTVETGTVRFAATLVSNNGTTLSGDTSEADIQEDGFTVLLEPRAERPILAVSPDSIMLEADTPGNFAVFNLGAESLEWSLEVPAGGLVISPTSGSVAAGQAQPVAVSGGAPPGEAVLVRFLSAEGDLEAKVQGVAPIFTVTVTPDGDEAISSGIGTDSATFVVQNTGNVTDTYDILCAGDGAVECIGPNLTSVELDSLDSATVIAEYTASGDGTLSLTASSAQATDQGTYIVTFQVPIRKED